MTELVNMSDVFLSGSAAGVGMEVRGHLDVIAEELTASEEEEEEEFVMVQDSADVSTAQQMKVSHRLTSA